MKRHAVEMVKLFPAGSNNGVSEALPSIWEDWAPFTKIASELEMLSVELAGPAGAAKSSSVPLMAKIGGTCSSCHKDYRKEKN